MEVGKTAAAAPTAVLPYFPVSVCECGLALGMHPKRTGRGESIAAAWFTRQDADNVRRLQDKLGECSAHVITLNVGHSRYGPTSTKQPATHSSHL